MDLNELMSIIIPATSEGTAEALFFMELLNAGTLTFRIENFLRWMSSKRLCCIFGQSINIYLLALDARSGFLLMSGLR